MLETLQTTLQTTAVAPTTHAELPLRIRVATRCAPVRASRQLPLAKLPAEILLKLIGTLVARPTHAAEAAPRRDGRYGIRSHADARQRSTGFEICHGITDSVSLVLYPPVCQ